MATKSSEIKKALRKAFPTIKFSVTYKHPYGYTVKWENGIIEGATTEAVKEIASNWDTSYREELGGGDCYYGGDSVRYDHEILDEAWKQFVIDCVLKNASSGVYFDKSWNSFRDKNQRHTHWENEEYNNYLYNGIKTDLSSHDAICGRDNYYRDIDEQKIDDLIAQEREYLSQIAIDPEFTKYVNQETETIKVLSVKIIFNRPDYTIYNREIVYDFCSETIEKPKPFSELETEPQFTLLDKESGEERLANLDGLLNILDPITPVSTLETDIRFINDYDWNRKINNLKYCTSDAVKQECLITEVIELSTEHYDRFTNNLLLEYEWLDEKGGTYSDVNFGDKDYRDLSEKELALFEEKSYFSCVLVFAQNKQPFLINPEGYGYSRYVAKVNPEVAKEAIAQYNNKTSRNVEILPTPAPASNVIKIQDYKQKITEKTRKEVQSYYKVWVTELVNSDRVTEIIPYAVWLENNVQSVLQTLYKKFVADCLKSDRVTEIVSFEEWQQQQ